MRKRALMLGCLIHASTILASPRAAAQTPSAPPAGALPSPVENGLSHAPEKAVGAWSTAGRDSVEKPWGLDVVFGLPTGVRLFRELTPAGDQGLEIEAFAGIYVIDPMLGGGLRWHFTPYHGECNSIILRPGVDGYVLFNPLFGLLGGNKMIGVAAVDVDLVWQHEINRRCTTEFGFKVGAGDAFSSTGSHLLPIASILFGLRF